MAVYKICCCVQACRSLHSPESLFSNGSYHSQLLCARTTFGFGFIAIYTDVILFEILQSCVLIIYIRRKHSFLKCSYQWFLIWLLFSGSLHCLKHRSYHQNISILPGKSNPYNQKSQLTGIFPILQILKEKKMQRKQRMISKY